MSSEQRDNTGMLWKNNKKKKETDPSSQGSAKIDGVLYWISGWTNTTDDGAKYVKLSFKRKDAKAAGPEHSPA
jgi:hypothetical protein